MNTSRTKEEINRQIERVNQLYKNLPQYDFFGNDNWEERDVYLDMLAGKTTYSDYEDAEYEIETIAYEVNEWLEGSIQGDLIDDEDL